MADGRASGVGGLGVEVALEAFLDGELEEVDFLVGFDEHAGGEEEGGLIVGGQFTESREAEVREGKYGALGEGSEVGGESLYGFSEAGAVGGGDVFDLGLECMDVGGEEEGEDRLGGALGCMQGLQDCWGERIAPGGCALEELGVELTGGADPGFCGERGRGSCSRVGRGELGVGSGLW